MDKGVSIFYSFHEQSMPWVIAGIYSPVMKTEEEMQNELLVLLNQSEFNERDKPKFVNHNHDYAKHLLGEQIDPVHINLFNNYFPKGLEPENLPVSAMKYYYVDEGAHKFLWCNRCDKELSMHLREILSSRSMTTEMMRTRREQNQETKK